LRHLTNTGHHLDVQLRLSPVLSGLTAQYIIPGSNPLTDQYSIGANIQRFLPKNGSSTSETLSLGHDKTIRDWKRTISLSYLRERYDIFADPSSHNSRLLFPSLNFSRIKTDNLVDTRFGSKVNFLIRGASAHVVSNTNFIQGEIKGAYIYSPTPNSRILVRGDVGYTVVKDLTILPLTVRFFAGGIDSVRGFGYSSIGPGRYLKVASLEYQHHIVGDWNGAVFYDAGTAADHFNAPLSKGVGIGIIYRSLIGPIKVYVAHRQTTPPIHKGFGIEFSIGSDL
jgi:translocation and assembly module TamA